MVRIACIGSRDISLWTAAIMEKIGEVIVLSGGYIATGNALGSDAAFARGGNRVSPSHVILYLPWKTYNEELIVEKNLVTWQDNPEWEFIARAHHPVYDQLSKGAKQMMNRNAGILSRANACIAFLNHSKQGFGGTGHGWRIAGTKAIPRFDLATFNPHNREDSARLEEFLKKLLTKDQNAVG